MHLEWVYRNYRIVIQGCILILLLILVKLKLKILTEGKTNNFTIRIKQVPNNNQQQINDQVYKWQSYFATGKCLPELLGWSLAQDIKNAETKRRQN